MLSYAMLLSLNSSGIDWQEPASSLQASPSSLLMRVCVLVLAEAPGVVMANPSPQWRDHRRFGLSTLRNFGLGKRSMEERILREIQHVEKILDEGVGMIMIIIIIIIIISIVNIASSSNDLWQACSSVHAALYCLKWLENAER